MLINVIIHTSSHPIGATVPPGSRNFTPEDPAIFCYGWQNFDSPSFPALLIDLLIEVK